MTQEQISYNKLKPVKLYHHWHAIQIPEFNLDAEKANEWFAENFNYFSKYFCFKLAFGETLVICDDTGDGIVTVDEKQFLLSWRVKTGDWLLTTPRFVKEISNSDFVIIPHNEFVENFYVDTVNMGHIR